MVKNLKIFPKLSFVKLCQKFLLQNLVTFWCQKTKKKKIVKTFQKVEVNNLAGNGRFYQILLKTCSLVSWDCMWWILDHYTIFINFGSVLNFGKKLKIFPKLSFVKLFQKFFSCKSLKKKFEKNFFSRLKFGKFFFIKWNFEKYPTSYFGPIKKYQVDKKL